MDTVFDKNWFKREQNRLLWLLNHSTYFRRDLGIQECDLPHNVDITEITPNSFSWGDRYFEKDGEWFLERTTDFRGTDKFAHRMYYAFYPVWNIAHKFDLSLANRFAPSLNFGFDTLTQYPGSTETDNPCDGTPSRIDVNESWAVIRAGAGTSVTTASPRYFCGFTTTDSTHWLSLWRSIFCFDTSALTASSTISAAALSLWGTSKADSVSSLTPNIDIYTATPANTNALVKEDFTQIGTTSQTGSPITYADWSTTGYNDFTFSVTGRGNVSKTGISKFGARNANYDVSGTAPSVAAASTHYIYGRFASYTGTNNDPKLVVTYSVSSVHFLASLGAGK